MPEHALELCLRQPAVELSPAVFLGAGEVRLPRPPLEGGHVIRLAVRAEPNDQVGQRSQLVLALAGDVADGLPRTPATVTGTGDT